MLIRVLSSASVFSTMHMRYERGNFDLHTLWAETMLDRPAQADLITKMVCNFTNMCLHKHIIKLAASENDLLSPSLSNSDSLTLVAKFPF